MLHFPRRTLLFFLSFWSISNLCSQDVIRNINWGCSQENIIINEGRHPADIITYSESKKELVYFDTYGEYNTFKFELRYTLQFGKLTNIYVLIPKETEYRDFLQSTISISFIVNMLKERGYFFDGPWRPTLTADQFNEEVVSTFIRCHEYSSMNDYFGNGVKVRSCINSLSIDDYWDFIESTCTNSDRNTYASVIIPINDNAHKFQYIGYILFQPIKINRF